VREQEELEWIPTFFHKIPDEDGGNIWVYSGDYWEKRELKEKKIKRWRRYKRYIKWRKLKKYF